jgi:hypothetical protein
MRNSLCLFAVGAVAFSASVVLPTLQLQCESRRPRRAITARSLPEEPTIEVIVPAYLEATVIGEKIEELRSALASQSNALVTVVASDEATARAAKAADRVLLGERKGKVAAVNQGVASSQADIIVLSDANCTIEPPNWPGLLLEEFKRWDLVSAHKTETRSAEGRFWAFERATKDRFSAEIGTLSVVGEFVAFRAADFRNLPQGLILDDLAMAEDFLARGLRPGIASGISTSEHPATALEQWERRVRIAEGLFREQVPLVGALGQSPQGRLFLAHKLYRVTVGAAGFWVALSALAVGLPLVGVPLLGIAAVCIAVYRGSLRLPFLPRLLVTVVGLQAVPVAAAIRVLRRERKVEAAGLWKKIAR